MLNNCNGTLHHTEGHKAPIIATLKLLQEKGVKASHIKLSKFLVKFEGTGSIGRRIGFGRQSKITEEIKTLVEY